jgi:ribosome biogenesis GTPase
VSSVQLPGWDDGWAAAVAAVLADPDLQPTRDGWLDPTAGRVVRAGRGGCDVLTPDRLLLTTWGAGLAARAAHDPIAVPAAGDWVVVATWPDDRRTTEQVLPRRTSVVRAQVAAGSSFGQVLAANVDVVAVVEGLVPDPDFGRVERLLALAWSSGARPVVVLTKVDAVPQLEDLVDDVRGLAPGADVHAVSATEGTGLDPLRQWLSEGATIALLGASGVGKSTLLNARP